MNMNLFYVWLPNVNTNISYVWLLDLSIDLVIDLTSRLRQMHRPIKSVKDNEKMLLPWKWFLFPQSNVILYYALIQMFIICNIDVQQLIKWMLLWKILYE